MKRSTESGEGGFTDATRGFRCLFPLLPFSVGVGMQCQCMDGPRQLLCQDAVDLTMAPQQTLPFEGLTHDDDLEVALGARLHPVHIALIDHFQMAGGQGGGQLGLDLLLHAHGNDSLDRCFAIVARVGQRMHQADGKSHRHSALRRTGEILCRR